MTPFQQDQLRYIHHLAAIGQLMGSGGGGQYAITTITDDGGGNALITTAAPHGITGTPPITVTGNSVEDYNVEHNVDSVPSTTTLITNIAYTSDGTGGTWAPA